ncbi:hypothetical protein [Streptomyces griseoluteus]
MRVPARPGLLIVPHTPLPEADTAAKLEWPANGSDGVRMLGA